MNEKSRPYHKLSMRDSLQLKDTHRLKAKGWRKVIHANGNQNKARTAIFISDKTDCKPKTVKRKKRDKVIHYIMIKELIQQHFDVLLLPRVCLMGEDEENNMHVPSSIFY